MTSNQIRDFETLFSGCFTSGGDNYTRTVMLDGSIIWDLVNNDGSVIRQTGAPATPTPCIPSSVDSEIVQLCDVVAGVPVPFLRKFTWVGDHTSAPTINNYTMAGATYTVAGTVSMCAADATVQPEAFSEVALSTSPVTIPANVKSFSVLNLGLNHLGMEFADIVISGGLSETMFAAESYFEYNVEEDQDSFINAAIVVTPNTGHEAKVRWII
jgi:ligand-binding SRPBCC domain-containing protein